MTSQFGSWAGSSWFGFRFDMPWMPDFHGAEVLQPFLPTHVLLTLDAVPWFLCTSPLQYLFLPPAPPSGQAGQFSGIKILTGLQQLPSLAPRKAWSVLSFASVTWLQPWLRQHNHDDILWDTLFP